ncbi:hypothetical protein M5E88_14625 [Akkermansia muciniphila]|nr:hypothetical protein M5E88_14625 [Akkermansia muciniphila]
MPEDFSSMVEMAGSLQNLRHAMANQGVSCIMAHHASSGRDERWTDMERLEEQCTQQLESWKLENRTAMKAEAPPRLLNSLRETGGNIILACAAEVPAPCAMPSGMRKAMAYPSRYGSTRRRKKPPPLIAGDALCRKSGPGAPSKSATAKSEWRPIRRGSLKKHAASSPAQRKEKLRTPPWAFAILT